MQASKHFAFFLTFFVCLSAYNLQAQSNSKPDQNPAKSIGKTVTEIDKTTMVVYQDRESHYWFGSRTEGVFHYDGKVLTQFTQEDGMPCNRIRDIQEDRQGNLYFDSGQGISKYDGQAFEILTAKKASNWELGPDDVWFAGNWVSYGPLRYDGQQLYALEIPRHDLEGEFYSLNPMPGTSPYSLYTNYRDRSGNIWLGGSTFGALRFDGQTSDWISAREMTEIDPGPAPGVRSILEDNKGYFWFNSNVSHKYKVKEDKNGQFSFEQLPGIPLPDPPYCMALVQDDDDNIWLADYGGDVWRYDGEQLIHYPIKVNDNQILIYSMYKDKHGGLWLGTKNTGPLRYDGQTFVPFQPDLESKP